MCSRQPLPPWAVFLFIYLPRVPPATALLLIHSVPLARQVSALSEPQCRSCSRTRQMSSFRKARPTLTV